MKPLTYNNRSIIFFICSVVIVVMFFIFQVFNFGDLQRTVPSHFNSNGIADGYMQAKSFLISIYSIYLFLIALLFGVLTYINSIDEKIAKTNFDKYIVKKLSNLVYISKKLTLFDGFTLTFLSTSSFIYFINYSVLNYERIKHLFIVPVYLSVAFMIAVILIFTLGRTLPYYK